MVPSKVTYSLDKELRRPAPIAGPTTRLTTHSTRKPQQDSPVPADKEPTQEQRKKSPTGGDVSKFPKSQDRLETVRPRPCRQFIQQILIITGPVPRRKPRASLDMPTLRPRERQKPPPIEDCWFDEQEIRPGGDDPYLRESHNSIRAHCPPTPRPVTYLLGGVPPSSDTT